MQAVLAAAAKAGNTDTLKDDVKQIIKEEMQATNLPDAFVSALLSVFMGDMGVGDVVALTMQGVLKP